MAQNLSNLPVGAKVKYGKHQVNTETPWSIVWTIVAKNHKSTPAYPTNAITLHATQILDLRPFDASESTGEDGERGGNNRYAHSNIHTWLNSAAGAGAWYSAKHDSDRAPDSSIVVSSGTEYASRPGFLNHFTDDERNAILTTTVRVHVIPYRGGPFEDVSAKVFLPSVLELGGIQANSSISSGYQYEGSDWGYYTPQTRATNICEQAYANTLSDRKPNESTGTHDWWVRTPNDDYIDAAYAIATNGYQVMWRSWYGHIGVRPAMNLPSTLLVSDSTDNDGCYSVLWDEAPTIPPSINVPTSVYGGKTASISWGSSSDADGNLSGYVLERSYDGGAFEQIYKGSALSYNDPIVYGKNTIQYRVYAYDSIGLASGYATSATRTIINNKAPVISGSDSNLGVKTAGFSQTYTVTDAENNTVTVTEAIDGVTVRSYAVTLGASQTFAVTDETWLKVGNGSHAMTITATDQYGDSVVRTYAFEKSVYSFTVQNTTPYESSTKPVRIKLFVSRSIPAGADFKVYVCNNGFDSSPTWEDATSSVLQSSAHVFTNESKTAGNWGVSVKVVVARNNAVGACYVTQIGGNFE